jgi:hypothetical protein
MALCQSSSEPYLISSYFLCPALSATLGILVCFFLRHPFGRVTDAASGKRDPRYRRHSFLAVWCSRLSWDSFLSHTGVGNAQPTRRLFKTGDIWFRRIRNRFLRACSPFSLRSSAGMSLSSSSRSMHKTTGTGHDCAKFLINGLTGKVKCYFTCNSDRHLQNSRVVRLIEKILRLPKNHRFYLSTKLVQAWPRR